MVISFRFGSRAIRLPGSAIRSRIVTSTSNGASASAASASVICSWKTVISALPASRPQSAQSSATPA